MTKEEARTIKKALTDYKHLILSARNTMRDSLSCDDTFGSRRTLVDGLLVCCANAEYMDNVDLPKVLNILNKYDTTPEKPVDNGDFAIKVIKGKAKKAVKKATKAKKATEIVSKKAK